METIETILTQHKFFKDMPEEYLRVLAACGSEMMRFDPGQYVFREGEHANHFYLIRHGQIALEIHDPRHGPILIDTLGEDEVLGWSWLFPPYKWHFSARAVGLARAIALDAACLRDQSEADHGLGYELMKRFAGIIMQRLQATRLQVLNVYD